MNLPLLSKLEFLFIWPYIELHHHENFKPRLSKMSKQLFRQANPLVKDLRNYLTTNIDDNIIDNMLIKMLHIQELCKNDKASWYNYPFFVTTMKKIHTALRVLFRRLGYVDGRYWYERKYVQNLAYIPIAFSLVEGLEEKAAGRSQPNLTKNNQGNADQPSLQQSSQQAVSQTNPQMETRVSNQLAQTSEMSTSSSDDAPSELDVWSQPPQPIKRSRNSLVDPITQKTSVSYNPEASKQGQQQNTIAHGSLETFNRPLKMNIQVANSGINPQSSFNLHQFVSSIYGNLSANPGPSRVRPYRRMKDSMISQHAVYTSEQTVDAHKNSYQMTNHAGMQNRSSESRSMKYRSGQSYKHKQSISGSHNLSANHKMPERVKKIRKKKRTLTALEHHIIFNLHHAGEEIFQQMPTPQDSELGQQSLVVMEGPGQQSFEPTIPLKSALTEMIGCEVRRTGQFFRSGAVNKMTKNPTRIRPDSYPSLQESLEINHAFAPSEPWSDPPHQPIMSLDARSSIASPMLSLKSISVSPHPSPPIPITNHLLAVFDIAEQMRMLRNQEEKTSERLKQLFSKLMDHFKDSWLDIFLKSKYKESSLEEIISDGLEAYSSEDFIVDEDGITTSEDDLYDLLMDIEREEEIESENVVIPEVVPYAISPNPEGFFHETISINMQPIVPVQGLEAYLLQEINKEESQESFGIADIDQQVKEILNAEKSKWPNGGIVLDLVFYSRMKPILSEVFASSLVTRNNRRALVYFLLHIDVFAVRPGQSSDKHWVKYKDFIESLQPIRRTEMFLQINFKSRKLRRFVKKTTLLKNGLWVDSECLDNDRNAESYFVGIPNFDF
ncbi:unnamed protein product [Caenorhabditis nigoni]